jgi:hypothetical protein
VEETFEGGAVGLGGAAAKVLDEELPHLDSLATGMGRPGE